MIKKKNIVILGSTGSIGESACDIVRQFPSHFRIVGLSGYANTVKLSAQVREFGPEAVAIGDEAKAADLALGQGRKTKIFTGRDGLCRLAALKSADLVLVAVVGSEAIFPLLSAIRAGKAIALANKESIVMAGPLVLKEAEKYGVSIVPIDSEQSAIFQCLEGQKQQAVDKIYLTASGGPLWDRPSGAMRRVTIQEVLRHPRWKMGKKITVDSATLMNKGLEVIEAQQLFRLQLDQVRVVIHRQSLIHSMVEFCDGSILAQMSKTDMRLPIQYALSYPERLENRRLRLDPASMGDLTFAPPDDTRFPCLRLAYEAGAIGGTAPCVLNAANEAAVEAFLKGRLIFGDIPRVIEKVLQKVYLVTKDVTLDKIFRADEAARIEAKRWIGSFPAGRKGCS